MKRLLLVLWLTGLCLAQQPLFIPVWMQNSDPLTDQTLNQVVGEVARVNPNPSHIVLLVHGFDNTQAQSTQQFNEVTPRIQGEFAKRNQTVPVIGVQWNSAPEGGLLDLPGQYGDKVVTARSVGRTPMRQLLLKLQERFPKASLDVMAHSMGCELTAAALVPELKFDDESAQIPVFQPAQDAHLTTATLCGSDLDYDIWFKGGVAFRTQNPRVRFVWMTMSQIAGDDRDKVLEMRKLARGQAAGSTFPKMTREQYDTMFSHRAAVFDNTAIPENHAFLDYYSADRLARIVPSVLFIADPKQPEPDELAQLDQILASPNQVKALTPWLDTPQVSNQLYALWKLEQTLCGGSQHFADEYLVGLARKMRNQPRAVLMARPDSPCQTVHDGYWPTKLQMKKAGAPED